MDILVKTWWTASMWGASTITKYMKIIISVIVQILFSKYFHNLVGSGCVAL
jgi:hypothetical protein